MSFLSSGASRWARTNARRANAQEKQGVGRRACTGCGSDLTSYCAGEMAKEEDVLFGFAQALRMSAGGACDHDSGNGIE